MTLSQKRFAKDKDTIQSKLFFTKQLALDSGANGEVYIGSLKCHSVCKINDNGIQFVWHRTYWG